MNQSLFHHSKQQEYCPQCGAPLQIKQGKKGLFLGCSAYPECDYLRPLQRVEHKVLKTLDEICPKCGNLLQLKQGSFGMFIGCSHYPECDFVVREESESEEKIACPECKTGHLISRRGRQGKFFTVAIISLNVNFLCLPNLTSCLAQPAISHFLC